MIEINFYIIKTYETDNNKIDLQEHQNIYVRNVLILITKDFIRSNLF